MRLWTISKMLILMAMSKMTITRMRMGMRVWMMMRTRMMGMR